MYLRQSTSQTIRFGPFLDSTDGVTAETALTIAQADMRLSKDGGAFAQKNAAGNATHDADGWYSTTLNATDTNTVGELILQVAVAGALPVWERWYVVEEAVYDAFFASSSAMAVTLAAGAVSAAAVATGAIDADAIASDAITSAKIATGAIAADAIASNAITADKIAADAIGASELAADAVAEIADAVWDEAQAGHTTAGTFGEIAVEIADILTDTGTTLPGTLSTIDGKIDTVDANVDAILVDTGTTIPAQITALNDLSAAEVNAEVVDALSVDTYAEPGAVPAATSSLAAKVGWLFTLARNKIIQTQSQQQLRNDADSANIATAQVSTTATETTRDEFT